MSHAVIFGELLIDHKTIDGAILPPAPGGPPSFISRVLKECDVKVSILAHRGRDYPESWIPKYATILPHQPTLLQNPQYVLEYESDRRRLRVSASQNFQPVSVSDIHFDDRKNLLRAELAYFASTLPVYSPDVIREWISAIHPLHTVLLAQGIFRDVAKDGGVKQRDPKTLYAWLDAVYQDIDLIVCSDQDHLPDVLDEIRRRYAARCILAVTKGIEGAVITYKEKELVVPTKWRVVGSEDKPVDATGAGDRWAAAFSYFLFIEGESIDKAAENAHQTVASYLRSDTR